MTDELSRRTFLAGLGAASGLALAGLPATAAGATNIPGHTGQPGDRPYPRHPEGTEFLPRIEHIIIYMQENHSYDSYYGMLPRGDGYTVVDGVPQNSNPLSPTQNLDGVPRPRHLPAGPGRVAELGQHPHPDRRRSHGRLPGRRQHQRHALLGPDRHPLLLLAGPDLPDLRPLVRVGPVPDLSEPPVPAGRHLPEPDLHLGRRAQRCRTRPAAPSGTSSNAFGITWNDYAWDLPDIALFPHTYPANASHVKSFDQFLTDCRTGSLPHVSIVSPGINSYTEENPHDVQLGEAYSASIINAVMNSPAWPKTALFFMYDEHGGYYDHVPPPPAVPPDDILPGGGRRARRARRLEHLRATGAGLRHLALRQARTTCPTWCKRSAITSRS